MVHENSFFEAINLFASTMYIVQLITIFIIYFFIAPYFLKNINWKSILFSIICSFTTFIIVRYFIEQIITDFLFHKVNYFEGTTISFYIYDNLHYGSFIVFSSLFLWMTLHSIHTLKQNNIIEKEKKESEEINAVYVALTRPKHNLYVVYEGKESVYSDALKRAMGVEEAYALDYASMGTFVETPLSEVEEVTEKEFDSELYTFKVDNKKDLPIFKHFFAGGDYSNRGYSYQKVGKKDLL